MKKLSLLLMMACCLTAGSVDAQAQKPRTGARPQTSASASQGKAFKVSDKTWSQTINLNQDLTKLGYEDLYYLRALVYATHGKWYTDGEVSQLLSTKAEWYSELISQRLDKYYKANRPIYDDDYQYLDAFLQYLEGTPLTQAEKAFVAKIDARMKTLETTIMKGRTMESTKLCVNLCQLEKPTPDVLEKLDTYNFAMEQSNCEQLFNIYEQNDYNMMPNFVTTDAFLQVTHMYLAYVQKCIEQQYFVHSLESTFAALHQQAMADAARLSGEAKARAEFVATYAAIGLNLLTQKTVDVPVDLKALYAEELENLKKEFDCPSALLETKFDFMYSLFRPRGHYTRSEEQKRYFKAMMWMQTARFEADPDRREQLKRAFTLAAVYNELSAKQRSDFEHMNDVIAQLTGPSDNVSVLQMAEYLKQQHITDLTAIDDEKVYDDLLRAMEELNNKQNQLSTNAEADAGFYINMMPQRFLVDNEVLRNVVDERPNAELPFPRGLDVFAAFGSTSADDLLYNFYDDDSKWDKFDLEMKRMKAKYADKPVGLGTIYDRRLQLLVDLSKDHPKQQEYSFYNTPDWQRKELNTALASWATLKHDAILYAEQPMLAECGGGEELPPPTPMVFVEPNVKFWNELSRLVADTKDWLEKGGYLSEELEEKTGNLLENITMCKKVAEKEARGEAPNMADRGNLKRIGSTLEWMTLGLIDPDVEMNSWDDMTGADRSVAQVADVFTRNIRGCQKCGVLYSACGNANIIYVLVKVDGKTYLTRGASYGYYEFTLPPEHPRLTDEEWQKEVEKGTFSMPSWMAPYFSKDKVKIDENYFYGTGC